MIYPNQMISCDMQEGKVKPIQNRDKVKSMHEIRLVYIFKKKCNHFLLLFVFDIYQIKYNDLIMLVYQ